MAANALMATNFTCMQHRLVRGECLPPCARQQLKFDECRQACLQRDECRAFLTNKYGAWTSAIGVAMGQETRTELMIVPG